MCVDRRNRWRTSCAQSRYRRRGDGRPAAPTRGGTAAGGSGRRAIGLATVATHDGSQRGVGLHRRTIDADPLTLHQAALGDEVQNPAKDFFMRLMRQAASSFRQPGMVGNLVSVRKPQEIPQRVGIRAAPHNAALAVDALEITDHVHAEIAARRKRGRAHARRVIGLADLLNETVEPRLGQQLLKLVVEGVPRRTRHLRPGRNKIALNPGLTSHRHRRNPVRISMFERNQVMATSSTRC